MEYPERVFKRKIYEKLVEWKRSKDGKTALLIRGARRVGKSTIAEEFAKREYASYIKVDFFAKQSNVDLAARLGYTAAELPKLNRAINLFMAVNPGIDEHQAALEVMTSGKPANRLMGYGGRFLEDAKSFGLGLKLIGDFATWHASLKDQTWAIRPSGLRPSCSRNWRPIATSTFPGSRRKSSE